MKAEMNELSPEMIEEFDALYDGVLDETRRMKLEDEMSSNPDLAHHYLAYHLLRKNIEADALQKHTLKAQFRKAEQRQNSRRRIMRYSVSLVAAAAVILLIFRNSLPLPVENIYEQYKNSEAGLPILMNRSPENILNMSMIDIANANYDRALAYLSSLPESDTSAYYIGFCNEMLQRDGVATSIYSRLENSSSEFIAHKSTFRLGLMYLKANNSKCEAQIRKVAENPLNPYQAQAVEIIEQLVRD